MTESPQRRRRARFVVGLLALVVAAIGVGRVALAHTDFDSSEPTDGAVVEGPLADVVLNFTNPARPAGDGFELLDPDGTVRSPAAIDETDGTSFVLSFDPPLDAGTYGLRWSVQAGDAHPIEGSFRFEVAAVPGSALEATDDTPATGASPADESMTGMDMDEHAAMPMADEALDEFLDTGSAPDDAAAIGRWGRTMSMLGTIFGVGALAALIWTVRGPRHELAALVGWVRLAGLVVFTGGLLGYASLISADPSTSWRDLMGTRPGFATALSMAGGLAMLVGFGRSAGRMVSPARSVSAAVMSGTPTAETVDPTIAPVTDEHRWVPAPDAALGLAGAALALVSFSFDGHTVTKGPWAIHSIVNLVHVGAASVWAGCVFAMTLVAWARRRRAAPLGLADMVVRFSSTATVSLLAVVGAGAVMTWFVVDSPGDVFGTDWGRVLVAKTAVVAVAAAMGGYNHLRLRPELERRPDDPALARRLRVTLSIESVAFVAVVGLTAVLVASAI